MAKSRIRDFVKEINRRKGTTFLLTTHDMDDIEQICGRLMLINHGRLGYDGSLSEFQARYGDPYQLCVTMQPGKIPQHPRLQLVDAQEGRFTFRGSKAELPIGEAVSYLSTHYSVRDLRIEESSLESILKAMY